MIQVRRTEDGKTLAKLSDLTKFPGNPRTRTDEDYIALKRKIVRLGLFRELFINDSGIVIGGNQRLDALNDLNTNIFEDADLRRKFDEVPVKILSFAEKDGKFYAFLNGQPHKTAFDSIDAAMIEFNLADNDSAGTTDKQLLMKLIQPHIKVIPLPNFRIQIQPPIKLDVLHKKELKEQKKDVEQKSKKIVLKAEFTPDQFAKFEPKLEKVKAAWKAENMTDLIVTLVEEAESLIDEKAKTENTPETS